MCRLAWGGEALFAQGRCATALGYDGDFPRAGGKLLLMRISPGRDRCARTVVVSRGSTAGSGGGEVRVGVRRGGCGPEWQWAGWGRHGSVRSGGSGRQPGKRWSTPRVGQCRRGPGHCCQISLLVLRGGAVRCGGGRGRLGLGGYGAGGWHRAGRRRREVAERRWSVVGAGRGVAYGRGGR